MNRILIIILLCCFGFVADGQSGFQIEFVPYAIDQLPPLHAYSFAQHDDKWLIIGGRTGREEQPSHLNYDLMVVDPLTEEFWIYPMEMLGVKLEEPDHLGNCYAAYCQDEEYLYIVGGMGYSTQSEAFGSFPYLTVVNVPKVMDAIINKKKMEDCFFQIEHEAFGRQDALLTKIGHYFYLTGGRQLSGNYNEEGELVIKEKFSNNIFSFLLKNELDQWKIIAGKSFGYDEGFENAMVNVIPQIFPDGEQGLTVFLNKPHKETGKLNWMNIFDFGYSTYTNKDANLAHFHSTVIPVFDSEKNQMHTLFIGGCDEYYCEDKEDYAPGEVSEYDEFTRYENGENKLSRAGMDAFMARGRDAQFILNEKVRHDKSDVIDLEKIGTESQLIGYVYGGATAPGMMIYNDGSVLDTPVNQLFKVYLTKTSQTNSLGWQPTKNETSNYVIYVPLK